MELLRAVIDDNQVWQCLDCGKCSAVCPITKYETRQYTSPRLLVEMSTGGRVEDIFGDPLLWACLTCQRCSVLCPSDVHFVEFLRGVRGLAREEGLRGECTHGAIFQTLGPMMADPELRQSRLDWLDEGCQVSEESETAFFAGCAPYFAAVFEKLGVEALAHLRASVRILNHLGIEPQVLEEERCCGHDQLWQGDEETFRQMAELNLEAFKAKGIKRIVTSCPECARTLKLDYPQDGYKFEVVHLAELMTESDLGKPSNRYERVTYHDPCRLGRHLGVYDAPRAVVSGLGLELAEMEKARHASLCCGTSCWTACGQVSKEIQVERLKEAKATGADALVTACLKCQIHFKCAQDDPIRGEEIDIEVRDLITLAAEGMVNDGK